MSVGKYYLYAVTEERTALLSVTADTEEEEEQLQDFYKTLDPDLYEVIRKFDPVFAPPDREPPETGREASNPAWFRMPFR